MGIDWEYEPPVRGENSYRPDFLIYLANKKFLIELHIEKDIIKEDIVKNSRLDVTWIYLTKDLKKLLKPFKEVTIFQEDALITDSVKWKIMKHFYKKVKVAKVEELKHRETVYDVVEPKHKLFLTQGILTYDTVNFGILYGKTEHGLAVDLNVDRNTAKDYIESFFEGFPKLRKHLDKAEREIKSKGYVTTAMGRRIFVDNWDSTNKGKLNAAIRSGSNATIQSPASDLVLWTVGDIYKTFKAEKFKSLMVASIHDSVEFDCKPGELFKVIKTAKDAAEINLGKAESWIKCPMELGVEMGASWGGALEFDIAELTDSYFKGIGEGLRCDVLDLVETLEKAYKVSYKVLKVSPKTDADFNVAYVVRDTEYWEIELEISCLRK